MHTILNRYLLQPLHAKIQRSRHWDYFDYLQKSQYDSAQIIQQRQWLRLQNLLLHAWDTVPYYRQKWSALGIHPLDIRSPKDFKELPVLRKQDIRQHFSELHSISYDRQRLIHKTTSGSTGVPLTIAINNESMAWKRACTIRSDGWSGYRLGGRVAKVWGNPEYQRQGWKGKIRNRLLDRAIYLDTRSVDDHQLSRFSKQLQQYPPSLLFGHAHSLYLLALYMKKHPGKPVQPDGIISTAMILPDYQRQLIEAVFGTPVTNRYGCEEVSLIACECEKHNGLHLNSDSLYTDVVESIEQKQSSSKSLAENGSPSPAHLCVTDLTNFAMPIIRYQIGDVVTCAPAEPCSCGRGLPQLAKIEGRSADYILTPTGKLISGISLTENFALLIPGIAQIQLVQPELYSILLRIVLADGRCSVDEKLIEQLVQETFGTQMRWGVEYRERIAQESSGKYRFCISPVADAYLRSIAA